MGLFDPDTSTRAINAAAHYPTCRDPLCGSAAVCEHCLDLWEAWFDQTSTSPHTVQIKKP